MEQALQEVRLHSSQHRDLDDLEKVPEHLQEQEVPVGDSLGDPSAVLPSEVAQEELLAADNRPGDPSEDPEDLEAVVGIPAGDLVGDLAVVAEQILPGDPVAAEAVVEDLAGTLAAADR